jgi:biopolymer transport protein ExbD
MRKKRRRKQVIVPVAGMGDIAFLLIIFFLVASRLAQDKAIERPTSMDAEKLKETRISVQVDADGIAYVNGRRMESGKEVKAEVKDMLDRRVATNSMQRIVMFKCDKNVRKNIFEPIIEAISEAGGLLAAVGDQGAPKEQSLDKSTKQEDTNE